MANPQPDKYTKISNELLDELCKLRIPGEAAQVFLFIIRKTYGYQKKEDLISLGQFSEATGLKKPNVVRSINKLTYMNIVIKKDNGTIPTYCIQKNYDLWRPLSKTITTVIQNDNKPLSKTIPTKERKENYTKETLELFKLFSATLSKSQKRYLPKTDAQANKWYDVFEKLIRIDKYLPWQVADVIDFFREDEFWNENFITPIKLRRTNREGIKYMDYFWEKFVIISNASGGEPMPPETSDLEYIESLIKKWEGK